MSHFNGLIPIFVWWPVSWEIWRPTGNMCCRGWCCRMSSLCSNPDRRKICKCQDIFQMTDWLLKERIPNNVKHLKAQLCPSRRLALACYSRRENIMTTSLLTCILYHSPGNLTPHSFVLLLLQTWNINSPWSLAECQTGWTSSSSDWGPPRPHCHPPVQVKYIASCGQPWRRRGDSPSRMISALRRTDWRPPPRCPLWTGRPTTCRTTWRWSYPLKPANRDNHCLLLSIARLTSPIPRMASVAPLISPTVVAMIGVVVRHS